MTNSALFYIDTTKLQQAFKSCFSSNELRDLCFELTVEYEDLGGEERAAKIRKLISYMQRRGRLEELLLAAQKHRPHIPWTEPSFWQAVGTTEAQIPGVAPYKGMAYFDEPDAHLFFGRETLTVKLAGLLRQYPFLAVVGASGSGKSSLVRAGLVPLLKGNVQLGNESKPDADHDWRILLLTPTNRPLYELAVHVTADAVSSLATTTLMDDMATDPRSLDIYVRKHLATKETHLLIVVDQFEELFTLCREEIQRRAFIDNLLTAAIPELGGAIALAITLRADFYHHCAYHEQLRQALEQHQVYIGQMTPDELRRTITEPVRARWKFEPGLVELLLHDVGDEPGRLPLLSHALLETWRRRREDTLTFSGYVDAGGVHGAIAETAEKVFHGLDQRQQEVARAIFMRLTEPGEDAEDTRRRARLSELVPGTPEGETVTNVLQTLADARLVITDWEAVEVAHEALIREWPTLRGWLEKNREELKIHRRLTGAAAEWERNGQEPSLLYRGLHLDEAAEWLRAIPTPSLNAAEQTFMQKSLQKRQRERQQRFGGGAILLVAIIGVSWLFAFLQRQATINIGLEVTRAIKAERAAQSESTRASEEADRANVNAGAAVSARNLANARWLVAEGQAAFEEQDPREGLALVLQGLALVADPGEKESVLANSRERLFKWGRITRFGDDVAAFHVNSDHTRLLIDRATGTDLFWDPANSRPLAELAEGEIYNVDFSPDERLMVVRYEYQRDVIYNTANGQKIDYLKDDYFGRVYFSPDSKLMVVNYSHELDAIYETVSGELLAELGEDDIYNVSFDPDNLLVLVEYRQQAAVIYHRERRELTNLTRGLVRQLHFGPEENLVVVDLHDFTARDLLYRAGNGELIEFSSGDIDQVLFGPNSRLAVVEYGNPRGAILYHDEPREVTELPGETIEQAYFRPDTGVLLVDFENAPGALYDYESGEQLGYLGDDEIQEAYFIPERKLLLVDFENTPGALYDCESGEQLGYLGDGEIQEADFSPERKLLVVDFENVPGALYDYESGKQLDYLGDGEIQEAYFIRDGELLLVWYEDLPAAVFYTGSGRQFGILEEDEIRDLYPSPNERLLVVEYDFEPPAVYDTGTGQALWTLEWDSLSEIYFSEDSSLMLVDYARADDAIYRADSGELLAELESGEILGLDFLVNDQIWLIDYKIDARGIPDYIYDRDNGLEELQFGDIRAVYLNDDENLLLIDYEIDEWEPPDLIYDAESGWLVELPFAYNSILDVSFRSYDRLALLTYAEDPPAVYDTATGEPLYYLKDEEIQSIDFGPDDDLLLVDYAYGTDAVYNAFSGDLLVEFEKEPSRPPDFSYDGNVLIVSYLDGTSELWDVHDGSEGVHLAPLGPNLGVALFVKGDRQLAVRYQDGPAFLLDLEWLKVMNGRALTLPVGELIRLACQYPLSDDRFNPLDLSSYLDQIEGEIPDMCP